MQFKWLFIVWAVVSYMEVQSLGTRNSPIGNRPTYRVPETTNEQITTTLTRTFSGTNEVKGYPSYNREPESRRQSGSVLQSGAYDNYVTPQNCVCVPSNQCTSYGHNVQSFSASIVPRLAMPADTVCRSGEVCCRVPHQTTHQIVPPPAPPISTPPVNSCGRRNISFRPRLDRRIMNTGNDETQFGEFPWMALVFESYIGPNGNTEIKYVCGGSLIHPLVVMTSAHNVLGKGNLGVKLGEWDTQRDSEPIPSQSRDVREIIIHEEYTSGVLFNDIALLILSDPVTIAQSVAPICLPEQGESMDNRNCLSSGWGKNAFDKPGQYQHLLKKVELPIVSKATCEDTLRRKTPLGRMYTLHPSIICAGGEYGKDTCKGDGGSPLVCPSRSNPEVYVQAGIVSWGIDCGTDIPAGYTNVAQFRNWIDNNLRVYNIDIKRGF